jgi:hypothetical protein
MHDPEEWEPVFRLREGGSAGEGRSEKVVYQLNQRQ